jgi:hypothetical protein
MRFGVAAFLAAALFVAPDAKAAEPAAAAWEGVWSEIWGEFVPMKVVVRDGKVVAFLYKGRQLPQVNIRTLELSPSKLSFGDPPGFVATLTMTGANRAAGYFHGPNGESNAAMER